MSGDADRLREAFASRQLDQLIDLMDSDVTWRGLQGPGEPLPLCHDRNEVREVMAQAMTDGRDGRPVITFRAGRIVLIQDYPDRASALAAIEPSTVPS
jgi:ketosteroid isomerase-like protein